MPTNPATDFSRRFTKSANVLSSSGAAWERIRGQASDTMMSVSNLFQASLLSFQEIEHGAFAGQARQTSTVDFKSNNSGLSARVGTGCLRFQS
jgi:hypothetical protein